MSRREALFAVLVGGGAPRVLVPRGVMKELDWDFRTARRWVRREVGDPQEAHFAFFRVWRRQAAVTRPSEAFLAPGDLVAGP